MQSLPRPRRRFSYRARCGFALALTFSLLGSLAPGGVPPFDPFEPAPEPAVCSLNYVLPGDLPQEIPEHSSDGDFMQFAWRNFLALNAKYVGGRISLRGDNRTQWSRWSSTADLLNQRQPGPSGSRYYPPACREIRGYQKYRAIQQVGKVDDSFFEATSGGLSDDPVIDRFGNFLRYEILLSPALYNEIVEQDLYKRRVLLGLTSDVNLQCGEVEYVGGNPANPRMGSIVIKAAWMDTAPMSAEGKETYHTEKLLVFNPGYRNATGKDSCELKEMALVGAHIARKTLRQPNWTWATWEHENNAPDCTQQMPLKVDDQGRVVRGGSKPNQSCPVIEAGQEYAFNSSDCTSSDVCNGCNEAFAEGNTTVPGQCVNPFTADGQQWCLDRPPSPVQGKSQLCRQVPTRSGACIDDARVLCTTDLDCVEAGGVCLENYAAVNQWNDACRNLIVERGPRSVWSHYELIGIQWLDQSFSECANVQSTVAGSGGVNISRLRESVQMYGSFDHPEYARPVLGNTSMESYERSNCTGCHAKVNLPGLCSNDPNQSCDSSKDCTDKASCTQYSTDFMYWLALEAAAPPDIRFEGGQFVSSLNHRKRKPRWRWRSAEKVRFVPQDDSADDPRCLNDPKGTVKASIRVFNNEAGLDSGEIELPCEHWTHARRRDGFRYRNRAGLCDRVVIKEGRYLRVMCRDPRLLNLQEVGGQGFEAQVRLGRTRFCGRFVRSSEGSGIFDGVIPQGASSDCPIPDDLLGALKTVESER